jgi:hypothetical protein
VEPSFRARRRVPVTPSSHAKRVGRSVFSAEEILDAMRRWADMYGEPPVMTDWEPARARRLGVAWRAERFESGTWPTVRMVRGHFESFSDAVAMADWDPFRARRLHQDWRAAVAGAERRRPGLDDLAASIRSLASARSADDPIRLRAALTDLAASALAWADAGAIDRGDG